MVISYLARIPEAGTFIGTIAPTVYRWAVDDEDSLPYLREGQFKDPLSQTGEFLIGRFSESTRDVCADYYSPRLRRLRKELKTPPYLELARCADDLNSIVKFTERWGPLGNNNLPGWLTSPTGVGLPADKEMVCCIDVTGWRHLKKRFQRLLDLTATRGAEGDISNFFRHEGWHEFDAGGIRLALGRQANKGAWEPQIIAASLYVAFVSMLWLDISREQMVLRCANPKCGEVFVTDRPGKKYCDPSCGAKVARRKNWALKGAPARKRAMHLARRKHAGKSVKKGGK